MARLFKRGSIWYAWIGQRGGGTAKASTNCTDKKAAERRAGELEREALDPTYAAANQATTSAACSEFLRSRTRRGRAEGTLHHYRVKLGHTIRLMPARLADVDAAACERFIERRLAEGAAQTTVKKEIRALGATLRHAKRSGLYMRDIESVIPELEDTYTPRTRSLMPLELVALVNTLSPERAAHVVFIVATGARWGESVSARLEVDIDGPMVRIRGTKTKGSARVVPVPPMMRSALVWSVANAPGETFWPWTNVRRDLASACEAIGIPPITPNDLRRTFATWLRASGLSPDLIGLALGHTTSRMSELVYGRIGPADLDRLITKLGSPFEMSHPVIEKESKAPAPGPLMGGTEAETGHSGLSVEIVRTNETAVKPSAQRRNRTADTGIFNPGGSAVNAGDSRYFGGWWAANGLSFRARANRWLTREGAPNG